MLNMNEKIFISISACNEKDLLQTVLSAINNAQYPDRLSFGIFEHSLDGIFTDLSAIKQTVAHAKIIYGAPMGVGQPRMNATLLSDNKKDFILQIDAHMIFENNWDTDLIYYYSLISQKYNKPIISSYVPYWFEDEYGNIKLSTDEFYNVDPNNFSGVNDIITSKLGIDNFQETLHRNYITMCAKSVDWHSNKKYEEHYGISGHFLFTSFDFVNNVLHDPTIPWDGDQLIVALRSWTRGYRIFTIPKSIVWHKNKWGPNKEAKGVGVKLLYNKDWRIPENSKDIKLFNVYHENSLIGYKKIKDIFLGDYLGYWGAPNKELLEEYQEKTETIFIDYYNMLRDYLINKNEKLYRIMYE